ncbi:MAG: hypothetical protein HKO53_15155 [Gemmatimonadetes bacterium]|nr:hypothetical protein [Gemmatimonadota bacterium]
MTGDTEAATRWVVGHDWSDDLFPYSSSLMGTGAFAFLCWLLWRAANREDLA